MLNSGNRSFTNRRFIFIIYGLFVMWLKILLVSYFISDFFFFFFSQNKKGISSTLYIAHSRVGRENLVSTQSVPHFPPNSGGITCCVAKLNAALCLDTFNENINLNKHFIFSSWDRTHNQWILPLSHDWLVFTIH